MTFLQMFYFTCNHALILHVTTKNVAKMFYVFMYLLYYSYVVYNHQKCGKNVL